MNHATELQAWSKGRTMLNTILTGLGSLLFCYFAYHLKRFSVGKWCFFGCIFATAISNLIYYIIEIIYQNYNYAYERKNLLLKTILNFVFAFLVLVNVTYKSLCYKCLRDISIEPDKYLLSISIGLMVVLGVIVVSLTEIVTDTASYESKPVIATYNILSIIFFSCLYFVAAYNENKNLIIYFAAISGFLVCINIGILLTDLLNHPIRKALLDTTEDMGANAIGTTFEDITEETISVNGRFTYVPDSISSKLNSKEGYPGCIYMLIMQDYSIVYSKDVIGINDDLSDLQADKFLDNTDIRAAFMLNAADLSYVDSVVPRGMNVYAGGNYNASHQGSPDFQVFKAIYFNDINQNTGRLIFFPGDFSIIQYDKTIGFYTYPSNILPYSKLIKRYSPNYIYEPTNVAMFDLKRSAPSNSITLTTKSGAPLTIKVNLTSGAVTIKDANQSTVDSYNLVLLA